ncbi:MAG: hypothetical protein MUO62_19350, partial [Anaerolineales bacterium]|nr:hypothetical protein [Anaerolineales bacterium]
IVFVFVLAAFDLVATMRGATITGRTAAGNVSTGLAVAAAIFGVLAFIYGTMTVIAFQPPV